MDNGMNITREEMFNSTIYRRLFISCDDDNDYYLHPSDTGEFVCEGREWKGENRCLEKRE
jgi:hypothetical protein